MKKRSKVHTPTRTLFFSFILFASFNLDAQIFIGFTDGQQTLEASVQIYSQKDSGLIENIQPSSFFYWNPSEYPSLLIKSFGRNDSLLSIENIIDSDTIYLALSLSAEPLKEVDLLASDSWLQRKRLQAFELWEGGWVFKVDKKLVVTDHELEVLHETPVNSFQLGRQVHLFRDIRRNIFLVGEDSVAQILPTDSILYFCPLISQSSFNVLIKDLLGQQDSQALIFRDRRPIESEMKVLFRNSAMEQGFDIQYPLFHNCGALIVKRSQGRADTILATLDTSAFISAAEHFGKYFQAYSHYWRVYADSGYFSPRLKERAAIAKIIYSRQYALDKQVYRVSKNGLDYYFDPYTHQVHIQQGNSIKSVPFSFLKVPRLGYLLFDESSDQYYIHRKKKGSDWLVQLEFNSNYVRESHSIKIQAYLENIRVHNNKIFSLSPENELLIELIE
jgi:hypothetical protein